MRRRFVLPAASLAAVSLLAACSGGDDPDPDSGETGDGELSGTITMLTNRTDIVDTTLQDYATEFQEIHPDVTVEFEAITDYEGDVSIRLNSNDYGDVLLIPNAVTPDQLPQFFEPLGTVADLGETYRFITERSYEDQVYGLATFGTAMGYVFNRPVWEEAGVTEAPTTREEFLDALQAISDTTEATPYYTNYADGWPLSQWQTSAGLIDGPDTVQQIVRNPAPWTEGNEQYEIDALLYQIVERGFSEEDPTTTNWEESKNLIGSGQVATMVLGSWALPQMQAAAEAAGGAAEDIGYWPMPWQSDGTFHTRIGGDYKLGISIHSDNQEAARAWVDWFVDESGFYEDQGGLSPRIDGESSSALAEFDALGVETMEIAEAPLGEETWITDIMNDSEIDLNGDQYRRQYIDIARGAVGGDMDSYFAELNERWASAQEQVVTD